MKKEVESLVRRVLAVAHEVLHVTGHKADQSPRFCTDFSKGNAVTLPDASPLPLIDDCIDDIGPVALISKLGWFKFL